MFRKHLSRSLEALAFVLLLLLTAPVLAEAQSPFGLRAGVGVDPDQFYFGAHTESRPLFRSIRFRPNLEAGFGDRRTVVALNGEFIHRFGLDNGYSAYVGAGPAVNIVSFDSPVGARDTRVDPGVNFLIGLEFPQRVFAELKVGAIDSPSVKFGVGYTFP